MKLIFVKSLLALSFIIVFFRRDVCGAYIEPDNDDVDFLNRKEGETEAKEHLRIARSPWWGRRIRVKVRIPNPVKKVGHVASKAINRVVSNVKSAIDRTVGSAKAGVEKLTSGTRAVIKKTTASLQKALQKVKERMKPAVEKGNFGVKLPIDLVTKLLAKLYSSKHKKKMVKDSIYPTPSTETPKPSCGTTCQLMMRNLLDAADFFKHSFCAFYTVRRSHGDFINDRNSNTTIDNIINVARIGSFTLHNRTSVAYNKLAEIWKYKEIEVESKKKITKGCLKGQFMQCSSTGLYRDLLRLKCFTPCHGFDGCDLQDKRLEHAVNVAFAAYRRWIKFVWKML